MAVCKQCGEKLVLPTAHICAPVSIGFYGANLSSNPDDYSKEEQQAIQINNLKAQLDAVTKERDALRAENGLLKDAVAKFVSLADHFVQNLKVNVMVPEWERINDKPGGAA